MSSISTLVSSEVSHSLSAIIFGITGQDGSYLAELLLSKNYHIIGVMRRSSSFNTGRIDHIRNKLELIYGDVADTASVIEIINKYKPNEIYNLAAQSHVAISFQLEKYTMDVDALGPLNILQAIRILNLTKKTKVYQASTSELYGNTLNTHHLEKLDENSPMNPVSPYAIAKLYAYHMVRHYRDAFGIFAVNGILQNHESSRRGDNFVTKKIILWAKYKWFVDDKNKECLHIGRLDSSRDWSHAKDMVRGMWMILQQSQPEDYVLGSGVRTTIREFIEKVVNKFNCKVDWKDSGLNEKGYINNELAILVDARYYRPNELSDLVGNPQKANTKLGWKPEYNLDSLIDEMIENS
jgi:GDPmannose 4,6-dehydratase